MDDNPYASSPVAESDPIEDRPADAMLKSSLGTLALLCILGMVIALGFFLFATSALLTAFSRTYSLVRPVYYLGLALTFGSGTALLWRYRLMIQRKSVGITGWGEFALEHQRFWRNMTIVFATGIFWYYFSRPLLLLLY